MSLIPWMHRRQDDSGRSLATADTFRNELDRLFESFFHNPFAMAETPFASLHDWAPTLDISENESEVTVRAEIPGVKPEDLDVTVAGDVLTLSGEKKESSEQKDKGYCHSESHYGAFRRQVHLPAEVDAQRVEAKYADGVLEIQLKKSQTAKAKRITVTAT
jgi:HSP20 family protein